MYDNIINDRTRTLMAGKVIVGQEHTCWTILFPRTLCTKSTVSCTAWTPECGQGTVALKVFITTVSHSLFNQ